MSGIFTYIQDAISQGTFSPESKEEKIANLAIDPTYYPPETASQIYADSGPIPGMDTGFDYWQFGAPTKPSTPASSPLSLWDQFKIAITPESYGESIANEIINAPVGVQLPTYDVNDYSSPNVYVRGKAAIKETLQAAGAGVTKWAKYIFIAAVVLIVLYAGASIFRVNVSR